MADIKLVLNLVNYTDVYNKLRNINASIASLGGISRAMKPIASSVSFLFSSMFHSANKWVTDMARTMRSAILRTAAYGVINIFRDMSRSIQNSLRDAQKEFLKFAQSAAIMTRGGYQFSDAFSRIASTSLDASKNVGLTAGSIADISVSLARAGVNLRQYNQMLEALSGAQLITGEKAEDLALDMVRMATAFGVTERDFKKLVADMVVGSSSAAGTIKDLVQSAKYLAPVIVNAYGQGTDSVKSFVAAVMAGTAAGVDAAQMARWLRTALVRMMAPSSEASKIMRKYGVDLYTASGQAEVYAERMKNLGDKIYRLERNINKLVAEENKLRLSDRAEEADEVAEKIDAMRKQVDNYEEALESLYEMFAEAGGRFRPLHEVFKEFADLQSRVGPLQYQKIIADVFSVRSSQAVQLLAGQIGKMGDIFDKLQNSVTVFDNMLAKILETAPGKVEVFNNSLTKLKGAIGSLGLESLWAPISEAIHKHLIIPTTKFIMSPEIQKLFKGLGERLAKDLEALFDVLTQPEKYTKEAFQIELRLRWEAVLKDLGVVLNALWKIFSIAGVQAGRLFGKGFADAVTPEIIKKIGRLIGTPGRLIEEASKAETKYKFWTEHPNLFKFLYGEKGYQESLQHIRERMEREQMEARLKAIEPVTAISDIISETIKDLQNQLVTLEEGPAGKLTSNTIAKVLSEYYNTLYLVGDAVTTNAQDAIREAAKTNQNIKIYGTETVISLRELGINLEKYLKTMQEEYLNLNQSVKRLQEILDSTRNRR